MLPKARYGLHVSATWLALLVVMAGDGVTEAEQGRDLLVNLGCIACHTVDGTAKQGPTFLGRYGTEIQTTTEDVTRAVTVDQAYLLRAIEAPDEDTAVGFKAGTMPSFALTDEEKGLLIAALVDLGRQEKIAERKGTEGSLLHLILSVIAFVGGHLLLSSVPVRKPLIGVLGAKGFQGVYSLLVAAAMGWMAWAWTEAPYIALWDPPLWTRWIPMLTMPIIMVMLVAGYTTKNPTTAGQESALGEPEQAKGIVKVTRHPANLAMALWGLVHVVPNPDVAALLLFGGVAGLGIAGTWHIERRRRAAYGADWDRFTAGTSVVPFAAILSGRTSVTLAEIGWWRIAAGVGLYVLVLYTHNYMVGATPWPW